MQLISWIALTYVAAGVVDAVMIAASIVVSTLINICNSKMRRESCIRVTAHNSYMHLVTPVEHPCSTGSSSFLCHNFILKTQYYAFVCIIIIIVTTHFQWHIVFIA